MSMNAGMACLVVGAMFSAVQAAPSKVHATEGPCDIYNKGGTPCVAAHSVVRALYSGYDGHLYQVTRTSDNTTKDIGVLEAGGFAAAAEQDAFCASVTCRITKIYDQSPQGNDLSTAPPGGAARHPDLGVNASRDPLTVGGHDVYSAYFEGGMGYRIQKTSGVAVGDEPESMYMVTAGKHYNNRCCFDYGNAESDAIDHGAGTMEAIYWGNAGAWSRGGGDGPWVMADLENGLWGGNRKVNGNDTPIIADFVTAMVKGRAGGFALKGGDACNGTLTTLYDGVRPNGYNPMKKQGAIILGIGGDNSDWAVGTFYEGVMTSGYSSDATDDAVQANIVAAGYGK
eukprot:m.266710 g.266710  ORF g.266710 m.266710 type:complete len:341 (-) comp19721_c0_seq1:247-1269(-)